MFAHAEDKNEMDEIELNNLDAVEFKEFLGVIYPTRYPITDANIITVFVNADRFDVKDVSAEYERLLLGTNSVRCFEKLKLTVDIQRDDPRNQLIATMNWEDVEAFQLAENRDELGMDVVLAVVERHKVLSASSDFLAGNSVKNLADISETAICGASLSAFDIPGVLAADLKLKVGDSVFYANKGAAKGKKDMDKIELKDLHAGEFKESLGVMYPIRYRITDTNVISMFRVTDRFDVTPIIVLCESLLMGANCVPWFDKLKLAVDLNREQLKKRLIRKMTWDDFEAVDQH
ncbi:hypothetical protein AAVH_23365 [Aphelenchoides avenae]|nr:hypothetical protein AAVH_23365 [Aphelenchus avenae]